MDREIIVILALWIFNPVLKHLVFGHFGPFYGYKTVVLYDKRLGQAVRWCAGTQNIEHPDFGQTHFSDVRFSDT